VLRFAIPGAIAAFIGAALLNLFAHLTPLYTYQLFSREHDITVIKLVIGILIIGFSLFELLPRLRQLSFDRKYLPLGGLLSGFFGGLSGNQGALRSAFLIKTGMEKEAFIGTGTVSAVIVDVARMLVYGLSFYTSQVEDLTGTWALVLAATLAAFFGAFMGKRLLKTITLGAIQLIVGIMLIMIGLGMTSGLI
jgi:uncharacterized membrane protein YfcA